MTTLLPPGTYVIVHESLTSSRAYIGRVVGYDMGHSKYHIGARYGGWGEWLFTDGGSWAFPGQVEEISEDEALRVEAEA